MSCVNPQPIYSPHSKGGITVAVPRFDGYTIGVDWTQAFPSISTYEVAYNIYHSTILTDVFSEGVKHVSLALDGFTANLTDFTPGDMYYFAVRAFEYDASIYNPALLPDSLPGLKIYPESILLSNITSTQTTIPISDITEWPAMGVAQIGYELIRYTSKDVPNNTLLGVTRGYLDTLARFHNTDGYDGDLTHDPFIRFWKGYEENNTVIATATNSFKHPYYPHTNADGYREVTKDNLTTDLSGSDAAMADFLEFDYVGYRRTDPAALFRGECIGTYYGGEQFCADGYGVGMQVRGVPFEDEAARRQEVLLELTGEPVVLVRRLWKGKTCSCYESTNQNPVRRCPRCFGTGFVTGYEQFFNPRRSDGRILVRFGPTDDDLVLADEGLESVLIPDCQTLVFPTVKDRDFIIRFNEDGTEEFRYEILKVNRNKLLFGKSGGQKFTASRIRRTDVIYQWRAIRNTATIPQTLATNIGLVPGPGGIPPHTHNIVINEGIVSLNQVNQTTSVVQGHNHPIINGVVQEVLHHTHEIILP